MSENLVVHFDEQYERAYQDAIVRLFREELHYRYLGRLQYAQGAKTTPSGLVNVPVREDDIRRFLARPEHQLTPFQIDEAVRKVKDAAQLSEAKKETLSQTNNDFYDLITSPLAISPDNSKPHENVYLFDFTNPLANDFAIAEEVSFIDPLTGVNGRPDLVVYVNGIALAVIELKRSTVSIAEGIKQHLSNEHSKIPSFFTTVQFTVAASDKNGFRYGTIRTPQKFWCPWKRDNHEIGNQLSDRDSFLSFFDKETFWQLFNYGVINDGGTKKVMRPHQHYALRAAMPRLKDKASGVIWHSQGSGKSLTMVWLARFIRENFNNARVLVITDRTELDAQIHGTFLKANEKAYRVKSANDLLDQLHSGSNWLLTSLIHKFGHHFDPATGDEVIGDDKANIPLEKYLKELEAIVSQKYGGAFTVKGAHKFVFVDECHRTQGGRLHDAMRKIMGDDVMFIGFTGTPLLKVQKSAGGYDVYRKAAKASEVKFGPFIHQYLHKEAVDDKVILDLQYEARDVATAISDKAKLEEKKAALLAGVCTDDQKRIEDRWATLEKVYSSADRIARIGYSILDDMTNYPLNQDWCNAMLVTGDIYSAFKYYKFFQEESPNTILRDRCAVVTSYNPVDSDLSKTDDGTPGAVQEIKFKHETAKKSFADFGVDSAEQYEEKAKRFFTTAPAKMKLLIVVDKLLTGFDAPSATYLYIDKDMRDHDLFQAICRVNRLGVDLREDPANKDSARIFTKKEFGLIVDFKHLFGNIRKAVTDFNDEYGGLGGYEAEDVEGLLSDAIAKNTKRLKNAEAAFDALRAAWEVAGITNTDQLVAHYNPLPPSDLSEEAREEFERNAKMNRVELYRIVSHLTTAYASISDHIIRAGWTEAEAEAIRKKVAVASVISLRVKQASGEDFDAKMRDPQMRELLDRFIRADEAECVIPATADFSFLDFISSGTNTDETAAKAVETAKSARGAAEKISAHARRVINDWHAKDRAQAVSFAERLQAIIDSINRETADTVKAVKALIQLLKDMKKSSDVPPGVSSPFARALWNNRKAWCADETDEAVMNWIGKIEEAFRLRNPGFKNKTDTAYLLMRKRLGNLMNGFSIEAVAEVYRLAANNLD